jgi:hypothetical protein
MRKVKILSFLLMLIALGSLKAQETVIAPEFKPSGNVFATVYLNYHYDLSEDASPRNVFALERAYLGYKYNFSENISFKLTIDAVRQVKDKEGNILSPYTANLKHAQLDWKVASPIKLSIGLIGTKQFDTQEKFLGYRYIIKSLQDEFSLGSSADLGVNAEIKLVESLKANLFVLNGEGYSKLQDDMGRIKAGGNLLFEPVEGLTLKGYYDIYGGKFEKYSGTDSSAVVSDTASIHSLAFFAGYKTKKFRLGAEYDLELNGKKYNEIAQDHDLTGIALYGALTLNDKLELFANFYQFNSNKLEGASQTWNYKKDSKVILGGIQYTPAKGVQVALNYKTVLYDNPDINTQSFIYLNFGYSF